MKCSQCATELADTATFCPRCGWSASQASGQPGSFSYLPPGAPPWPTSIPAQLPYVVDASRPTSAVPVTVAPVQKKVPSNILLFAAVLVLIPLVGVMGTLGVLFANGQFTSNANSPNSNNLNHTTPQAQVTPTATNVLPEPAEFKAMEETITSVMKVSLKYPGDWKVNQPQPYQQGGVLFAIVSPDETMGIEVLRFGNEESSLIQGARELNQSFIQGFREQANGVQEVTAENVQPTIGGVQWVENDIIIPTSQGEHAHHTVLSVKHQQVYYSIHIFVPYNVYLEALNEYFQPMLDSVQFVA